MKVRLLIISTILLLALSTYFLLRLDNDPSQTGGDYPELIPAEYYSETTAMSQLNSELPLSVNGITITFDFSKGKYIVVGGPGLDAQAAFTKWHASKPYNAIPLERFQIK